MGRAMKASDHISYRSFDDTWNNFLKKIPGLKKVRGRGCEEVRFGEFLILEFFAEQEKLIVYDFSKDNISKKRQEEINRILNGMDWV